MTEYELYGLLSRLMQEAYEKRIPFSHVGGWGHRAPVAWTPPPRFDPTQTAHVEGFGPVRIPLEKERR